MKMFGDIKKAAAQRADKPIAANCALQATQTKPQHTSTPLSPPAPLPPLAQPPAAQQPTSTLPPPPPESVSGNSDFDDGGFDIDPMLAPFSPLTRPARAMAIWALMEGLEDALHARLEAGDGFLE